MTHIININKVSLLDQPYWIPWSCDSSGSDSMKEYTKDVHFATKIKFLDNLK